MQESAGEGLVRLLSTSGQPDVAMALCSETLQAHPQCTWPWRLLADLQLRAAGLEQEAVVSYQRAVRAQPESAALWEVSRVRKVREVWEVRHSCDSDDPMLLILYLSLVPPHSRGHHSNHSRLPSPAL